MSTQIDVYNNNGARIYRYAYPHTIRPRDLADLQNAFPMMSGISIERFGVARWIGPSRWSIVGVNGFAEVGDIQLAEGIIIRNNRGVAAWPTTEVSLVDDVIDDDRADLLDDV